MAVLRLPLLDSVLAGHALFTGGATDADTALGLDDAVPLHPYVVYGLAGLGGAVVLASLSFHFVERPLLSLKRWVPDRAPAPSPEPTAAPAAATAP